MIVLELCVHVSSTEVVECHIEGEGLNLHLTCDVKLDIERRVPDLS